MHRETKNITGIVRTSLRGQPTSSPHHLGGKHAPPLTVILQPFAAKSRGINQNAQKHQCPTFNATLL